ncbi:MAG TPA: MotA/TolQ/ExbB proton channel family protein [Candidatus Ozemobacteraceae bacterium]|nr:MotA/TolQ/ExbB proton channel family protein [Candidatus Ozemobacteraceae bacterium]
MQKSVVAGFLIGFGALALSILIDSHFKLHAIVAFFNFSAMLIIFGGISGVIVIAFPPEQLREIPVALRKAFLDHRDIDQVAMSLELLDLAQKSRKEGVLSLEARIPELADPWMRRSLQLVVDGLDRKAVQDILEVEFEEYTRKTKVGAKIFASLGGFAPTLGIIGTVMGLVHMLANLEDPSKIGGAIAVAFLATFWGILSANMIFLPIAERVKAKDMQLALARQAMIEGVLAIQAGEAVRLVEEKLKVFMTPDMVGVFETERLVRGDGRQ